MDNSSDFALELGKWALYDTVATESVLFCHHLKSLQPRYQRQSEITGEVAWPWVADRTAYSEETSARTDQSAKGRLTPSNHHFVSHIEPFRLYAIPLSFRNIHARNTSDVGITKGSYNRDERGRLQFSRGVGENHNRRSRMCDPDLLAPVLPHATRRCDQSHSTTTECSYDLIGVVVRAVGDDEDFFPLAWPGDGNQVLQLSTDVRALVVGHHNDRHIHHGSFRLRLGRATSGDQPQRDGVAEPTPQDRGEADHTDSQCHTARRPFNSNRRAPISLRGRSSIDGSYNSVTQDTGMELG